MKAQIKIDTKPLYNMVKQQKQVPFAMQRAMNNWMFSTNEHLKKSVDQHLEGGAERFTKSGFRVEKVKNKRDLRGNLYVSLQYGKPYLDRYYLKNIIEGGTVVPPSPKRKKLMQPLPGRVKVNAKGNLTKRAYSTLRNQKSKYFYGIPKGREGENYRGLWERNGDGSLKMIIALGKEKRPQKQLFPAAKISVDRYNKNFMRHFAIEYRRAIRRPK